MSEKDYYDAGFDARIFDAPRDTYRSVSDDEKLRRAWLRGWDDADVGFKDAE